jgi:hypothetical protein
MFTETPPDAQHQFIKRCQEHDRQISQEKLGFNFFSQTGLILSVDFFLLQMPLRKIRASSLPMQLGRSLSQNLLKLALIPRFVFRKNNRSELAILVIKIINTLRSLHHKFQVYT